MSVSIILEGKVPTTYRNIIKFLKKINFIALKIMFDYKYIHVI